MSEVTISIELQFEIDLNDVDNIVEFISENILENLSSINTRVIDVIAL